MSPYHPGELRIQDLVGERAEASRNGRIIADAVVPGAARFIPRQGLFIAASLDGHHRPWASMVVGRPGFVTVPDPGHVQIDLMEILSGPHDPLWDNVDSGGPIGALFIDLAARVRYRVNGRARRHEDKLVLDVDQAYPNCPQYIHRRRATFASGRVMTPRPPRRGTTLGGEERTLIADADTAYVASIGPDGRADASHRGGHRGFIQMAARSVLRIPDYPGNGMFNTLGNLSVNPRAGLTIPDAGHRRILQMTGTADLVFEQQDLPEHTAGGTGRYWTFAVDDWLSYELPASVSFDYIDASPVTPVAVRAREGS